MKRATVLKPIQFLFCALLCFFGASEAHAVMTTHAQGSWVKGSKYRVGGFEAEVPGSFRESANLTHGSAIGYESSPLETASGRPYYCNGDPINNYDPDGRFGKGQNAGNAGMISSGDPNSPAFYAELLTQSLWNGAATGFTTASAGQRGITQGFDTSSDEYHMGQNPFRYVGSLTLVQRDSTGSPIINGPVSGYADYVFGYGQPAVTGPGLNQSLHNLQRNDPLPITSSTAPPPNHYYQWDSSSSDNMTVNLTLQNFRYYNNGKTTTISDVYAFPVKNDNYSAGANNNGTLLNTLNYLNTFRNSPLHYTLGLFGTPYPVSGNFETPK